MLLKHSLRLLVLVVRCYWVPGKQAIVAGMPLACDRLLRGLGLTPRIPVCGKRCRHTHAVTGFFGLELRLVLEFNSTTYRYFAGNVHTPTTAPPLWSRQTSPKPTSMSAPPRLRPMRRASQRRGTSTTSLQQRFMMQLKIPTTQR